MSQPFRNNDQEWLKILGKGMVTLPKKWRDEMGIETGDVVKAQKEGDRVIIEAPKPIKKVPYRVYSDAEIDSFLKEDEIPSDLLHKVQKDLSSLKTR